MTGIVLVTYVRYLLRDDGRGKATASRYHQDVDIVPALYSARQKLLTELLQARYQKPALLTLSKRLSAVAATPATAVPTGFMEIEHGVTSGGRYVQRETAETGITMGSAEQVYVKDGLFQGSATNAFVWLAFTSAIDPLSGISFTDASDAFYYTTAYLAASELVRNERGPSMLRSAALLAEYTRRKESLQ